MAQPVNPEPLIPRAVVVQTTQGLVSIVSDLVRSLYTELRSHASAINGVIPVEGTWTPTITAATPGNLAVTYTTRLGRYIKSLPFVTLQFEITTSAFTHTTAAGNIQISGLPFPVSDDAAVYSGYMTFFSGFTSANYTQLGVRVSTAPGQLTIPKSGSGQAAASSAITDFPTGGTVRMAGEITYKVLQ